MEDHSTCYLWENGQRVKITYEELRTRRDNEPAFRRRRFWMFDGVLLEVTEEQHQKLRKEANHQYYLRQQDQGINSYSLSTDSVTEQDLLWGAPPADFVDETLNTLALETLRQAMSGLQEHDAALIRGLYMEGKTEREIAALLGISRGEANKRKGRILAQLRTIMKVE